MKTKLNFLVASLLFCSTMLTAGTASKLNLQVKNGDIPGTIQIQLEGLDNEKTQVNIKDLSGKSWFTEMIRKQAQFSKTINLNALPSGDYLLFVSNKRNQQSRAFNVDGEQVVIFDISTDPATPGGLILDAGRASSCITRIAAADAQTLRVHLSNLQDYEANMQLMGPDGNVRWEKNVSDQASFAEQVNVKALMIEPGTYFLRIEFGGATVIQELKISASGLQAGMAHHVSNIAAVSGMAKN